MICSLPVPLPATQNDNKLGVIPSNSSVYLMPAKLLTAVNAQATARFSRGYKHWLFIHSVNDPTKSGGLFKSTGSSKTLLAFGSLSFFTLSRLVFKSLLQSKSSTEPSDPS